MKYDDFDHADDDFTYPDIKENLNSVIEKLRQVQSGKHLTNEEIDDIIGDLNNVYTRLVRVGE